MSKYYHLYINPIKGNLIVADCSPNRLVTEEWVYTRVVRPDSSERTSRESTLSLLSCAYLGEVELSDNFQVRSHCNKVKEIYRYLKDSGKLPNLDYSTPLYSASGRLFVVDYMPDEFKYEWDLKIFSTAISERVFKSYVSWQGNIVQYPQSFPSIGFLGCTNVRPLTLDLADDTEVLVRSERRGIDTGRYSISFNLNGTVSFRPVDSRGAPQYSIEVGNLDAVWAEDSLEGFRLLKSTVNSKLKPVNEIPKLCPDSLEYKVGDKVLVGKQIVEVVALNDNTNAPSTDLYRPYIVLGELSGSRSGANCIPSGCPVEKLEPLQGSVVAVYRSLKRSLGVIQGKHSKLNGWYHLEDSKGLVSYDQPSVRNHEFFVMINPKTQN